MTRAFLVSAALLALGVTLGTASDDRPDERPVVTRGPWRVLQADFHAHSRFSDGFLTPPQLVMQAERVGLDVLAITEHNMVFPAKVARWWSELTGGPTILVGEEITTRDYHIHAIGIDERISPSLTLAEVIAETHRQGGLSIAAHPVDRFYDAFFSVLDQLDGAEIMHPISLRGGPPSVGAPASRGGPQSRPSQPVLGWTGAALVAFYEEARHRGKTLTAIGSSDYHFGAALGVPRTYVFARGDAAADVMDALRAGRTVVVGADQKLWGDPACVALLTAEPLPPPPSPSTASNGALDTIGRLLGLLGLVGLLAFRRQARPA